MATSSAASRKDGRACPDPGRQVAALDELRDDEAQAVLGAAHVEDRHDVGVVQAGQDAGFGEVRLELLGLGDAFRVRHLDGDRAVEFIVMGQIDPPEPALTEPTDDPVAPDLRGIAVRGATRSLDGRLRAFRPGQALRLVRGAIRSRGGRSGAAVSGWLVVSSIA